MYIPVFSNLFHKKKQLKKLDSVLISRLKSFAKEKGYLVFQEELLYYRSKSIEVPLLMFIPEIGILLFEYKEWSFKELSGAKISKATHTKQQENTLAFDTLQEIIAEKYNDALNEDIAIYNFVLMEQLTFDEYNNLDSSFFALLPQSRAIFNDSSKEDFRDKFLALPRNRVKLDKDKVLPYIFSQYLIIDDWGESFFATNQQREFIKAPLSERTTLKAPKMSGKSTLLLQKALLEVIQNKADHIAILTPNETTAKRLQLQLVQLIEHAMILIDLSSIAIFSPLSFLNAHREKLKLKPLNEVDTQEVRQKECGLYNAVFCDDAHMMDEEFISYILQSCKKAKLLFATNTQKTKQLYTLTQSFSAEREYKDVLPLSFTMRKIYQLEQKEKNTTYLVITPKESYDLVCDDISNFCGITCQTTENTIPFTKENPRVILSDASRVVPVYPDYIFTLIPTPLQYNEVVYQAKKKCFILEQNNE